MEQKELAAPPYHRINIFFDSLRIKKAKLKQFRVLLFFIYNEFKRSVNPMVWRCRECFFSNIFVFFLIFDRMFFELFKHFRWKQTIILGASRRPPTPILLFFSVSSRFFCLFNREIDFSINTSIFDQKKKCSICYKKFICS